MSSEPAKEAEPPTPAPPPSSSQAEPATQHDHTTTTQHTFITEDPSTAPDPDEDDLSDLDDVLDEFAATNISKPSPSSSGPGRPAAESSTAASTTAPNVGGAGPGGLFASEDEFAKAMQAGMAELLGEFESNPEMAKQFEDLVKELGEGMGSIPQEEVGIVDAKVADGASDPLAAQTKNIETKSSVPEQASNSTPKKAAAAPTTTSTTTNTATPSAAAQSFEDTIRATMERMSASNTAASTAASKSASAAPDEDFLAAMLREMEASGGGAGGLGSDEDFSKMLMGMMEQLTNKEILYEPMKELHDKFPGWMKENEGKVKKEDWERYVEQQRLVGEIVAKFEVKDYSDSKVEYREYIVERMQLMQAAGSPPPDLVGDMNAAQEALGDFDAGCPQQ